MFNTKNILLFAGLVSASSLVLAADEKKPAWKGEVGAGYIATTGNSDTSKLNVKAEGTLEKEKWRHYIKATALNSDSNGVTDAEKYFTSNQDQIKAIINHPSIQGANLRGSIVGGLFNEYNKLLSIGQELTIEIDKIVKGQE